MARRETRGKRGMSLIELLVALGIAMALLVVAVPSFADWLHNLQIRSTAESLQAGLQYARTEAIRRNAIVRWQLVDTPDSSCVLSATGSAWVVNLGSETPAGACAQATGDGSSPYVLRRGTPVASNPRTAISAGRAVVAFDGLGRQHASAAITGGSSASSFSADLTGVQGSCVAAGGTVQCLRVVVSIEGQVGLCDPAHTASGDVLRCPDL